MQNTIQLGLYQHYKGNYYQVIGLARHSETLEALVVYQAFYGDFRLWVRPLELFMSTLMHDTQEIPRFKFVGELLSQLPAVR